MDVAMPTRKGRHLVPMGLLLALTACSPYADAERDVAAPRQIAVHPPSDPL